AFKNVRRQEESCLQNFLEIHFSAERNYFAE
ncbi:unnamed protein product, partial [Oikopleura dioica]